MKSRPIGNSVDATDFSVGTIVIARLMQLYVLRSIIIIISKNRVPFNSILSVRFPEEFVENILDGGCQSMWKYIPIILFLFRCSRFQSVMYALQIVTRVSPSNRLFHFFLIENLLLLVRSDVSLFDSLSWRGLLLIKCNTIYIDRREN